MNSLTSCSALKKNRHSGAQVGQEWPQPCHLQSSSIMPSCGLAQLARAKVTTFHIDGMLTCHRVLLKYLSVKTLHALNINFLIMINFSAN